MRSNYRPKLQIPFSNLELVIEVVCVIILIVLFSEIARVYSELPESVVSHFNANGEPDSFSRTGSVFMPAIVALGIYLLMTVISRFPHLFNYPVKITEENAWLQYQLARNYIAVLKLSVIVIFTIVEWNILYLSIDSSKTILQGYSFLVFLSVVLTLPFGYYIMQAKKNK